MKGRALVSDSRIL